MDITYIKAGWDGTYVLVSLLCHIQRNTVQQSELK